MSEQPAADQPPTIEVVRGNPTDEELAALLAVLTPATRADRPAAGTQAPSGWSAYWRAMRAPLTPGPGGWRASGRVS